MDLNAQEKARELADMVGSLVVDENLPLEVMEMTAVDIAEEERVVHGISTGTTIL